MTKQVKHSVLSVALIKTLIKTKSAAYEKTKIIGSPTVKWSRAGQERIAPAYHLNEVNDLACVLS